MLARRCINVVLPPNGTCTSDFVGASLSLTRKSSGLVTMRKELTDHVLFRNSHYERLILDLDAIRDQNSSTNNLC